MPNPALRQLVLASTSPFRKRLLDRLRLPFETFAPNIDESQLKNESATTLVKRLSEAKARTASPTYSTALIIGSDQVATLRGEIIGKPGNFEHAKKQLLNASGQTLQFFTGICLLDASTNLSQIDLVTTEVQFRQLSESLIDQYLTLDEPFGCAGSFKSEQLGITLFHRVQSNDPTALEGLPLIALSSMLEQVGYPVVPSISRHPV